MYVSLVYVVRSVSFLLKSEVINTTSAEINATISLAPQEMCGVCRATQFRPRKHDSVKCKKSLYGPSATTSPQKIHLRSYFMMLNPRRVYTKFQRIPEYALCCRVYIVNWMKMLYENAYGNLYRLIYWIHFPNALK